MDVCPHKFNYFLFQMNLSLNFTKRTFTQIYTDIKDIQWHLQQVDHSLQSDGINCGVFMCIFFERLVQSNFDLDFIATQQSLRAKRLEIKEVLLQNQSNFSFSLS